MSNILLTVVVLAGVAFFAISYVRKHRKAIGARFRSFANRLDPPPPPPEPEPAPPPKVEPEPAPVIYVPPPVFGNIRPKEQEKQDPNEFGPEIHDFPEMGAPVTRFEDFNRRLFIFEPGRQQTGSWPNTTPDDFPTKISGISEDRLKDEINRRLRPRYPVVYDAYGFWAFASRQLEFFPGFTNEFVEAYLSIPEDQRPVVISLAAGRKDGDFHFMRYGFEDFVVNLDRLRLFVPDCLKLIMAAMIGPREQWLWFSVARMRKIVADALLESTARKQENEAAAYLIEETRKAKREAEHANRFLALWKNLVPGDNSTEQAVTSPLKAESGAAE